MMKIKNPILVTKSKLPPIEDYINEIKEIWDTNWLTNQGPLHNKFEASLKERLGIDNVTLFVNGHLALEAAFSILKKGGEVITTPFTFVSTTHAIIRNELKPVFCDINMDDYTIDVDKIESLITENTVAIAAVHVYGNPCDVYKLNEIATKYGLVVIYDAAHAFGVEVDKVPISNFGDISMFSLHATKVMNSIEGGLLAYNDMKLKSHFDLIKNFGISGPESVEIIGFNAKMNEFQAAMGNVNLRNLDSEIDKRRIINDMYDNAFSKISCIKLPKLRLENIKKNYAYYPILIENNASVNRDELFSKLAEYNIFARKYFYPIITEYNCYKNTFDSSNTPVAKYISDRVITLPMYGELSYEEVRYIIDAVIEIFNGGSK